MHFGIGFVEFWLESIVWREWQNLNLEIYNLNIIERAIAKIFKVEIIFNFVRQIKLYWSCGELVASTSDLEQSIVTLNPRIVREFSASENLNFPETDVWRDYVAVAAWSSSVKIPKNATHFLNWCCWRLQLSGMILSERDVNYQTNKKYFLLMKTCP